MIGVAVTLILVSLWWVVEPTGESEIVEKARERHEWWSKWS